MEDTNFKLEIEYCTSVGASTGKMPVLPDFNNTYRQDDDWQDASSTGFY